MKLWDAVHAMLPLVLRLFLILALVSILFLFDVFNEKKDHEPKAILLAVIFGMLYLIFRYTFP